MNYKLVNERFLINVRQMPRLDKTCLSARKGNGVELVQLPIDFVRIEVTGKEKANH